MKNLNREEKEGLYRKKMNELQLRWGNPVDDNYDFGNWTDEELNNGLQDLIGQLQFEKRTSIFKRIFLCLILIAVIYILVVFDVSSIFSKKSFDIERVNQENQVSQVPDLIKQLRSASIPTNFNSEKRDFIAFKDGKIELRGPEISMNDTTSVGVSQSVLYWSAQLNTDNNYYEIADFNGDDLEDVAIVIGETGGGSGYFYHLVVFLNENGNLKYAASQFLGDRIKIKALSYELGLITADIVTQGPNEGYCCGTMRETMKFRLERNNLILVI